LYIALHPSFIRDKSKIIVKSTRPEPSQIELDLGRYELRRLGRRVRLEKKPMELLIFLVARREQLVSRDDIVRKLWRSDLFIDGDRNLNNIVRKIRTALGDDSAKPRFIETVVGKGYRFIGPLRVIDAQLPRFHLEQFSTPTLTENSSNGRERASLAVLPLVFLGKTADEHSLCLGFADALISRLGNLQGLDVLPTSALLNLPPAMEPAEVSLRLGVRFVVHGAMHVSKGQFRVSLEMFDARLQRIGFVTKCDLDLGRMTDCEIDVAKQIAAALNRPLRPAVLQQRPRYSREPLAYAEFMRGYRLSSSGDPEMLANAIDHLTKAVSRDPVFALAHATLSFACATRHFEFDPASAWLERAEFHCQRAIEIDPDLAEAHVARAFLLWGPSKNFQHLEAISELRLALSLQHNLPHAYNRLGTILAHVGLLDHAREMYERGRAFHPRKAVSFSIVQTYLWGGQYEVAREHIRAWRAESPNNKYAIYFAPQPAMMTGDWKEAKTLLDEASQLYPDEPLIISLQGVFCVLTGRRDEALDCITKACASPKSFGHLHHTYYHIACILAMAGRSETAFEWLQRSISTGFACWPFFLNDPCLESLRTIPDFEFLMSTLQGKYPDHLGLL